MQLPASGAHRDITMRLSALQLQQQRLRKHAHLSSLRVAAEEKSQQKWLLESFVLMYASSHGQDFTDLEPSIALALARAASNLLEADFNTAQSRIRECEAQLLILQDSADEIKARLEDANHQLGAVLHTIHTEKLDVETHIERGLLLTLQTIHLEQLKSPAEYGKEDGNEIEVQDSDYEIDDYKELTDSESDI